MPEVKTFKIERKFSGTEDLYMYLIENVEFIEQSIGIQIQQPFKKWLFCLTAKEQITERNIIFFASKSEFPESLGELIILAGAFDVDIAVFFLQSTHKVYLESINWLQKISNADTQFIVGEVSF
jgi:hypothetical protein